MTLGADGLHGKRRPNQQTPMCELDGLSAYNFAHRSPEPRGGWQEEEGSGLWIGVR